MNSCSLVFVNLQGPMRFNPKINMAKASFTNMELVKDGFTRQEGMFRAKTDTYFANSRIISDKDNTIMIGESARQFRMKLPNREFVALVAVGVRWEPTEVKNLKQNGLRPALGPRFTKLYYHSFHYY